VKMVAERDRNTWRNS